MPFSPSAASVYADGPTANPWQPPKPDIRAYLLQLEAATDAIAAGSGTIAKQTLSQLNADIAHGADTMAWVYADANVAANGIYRKNGASGSGSWSFALPLPYTYIVASNAGTGTASAIMATSSVPVTNGMLVSVPIFVTNTGTPVTIAFNSQTALTIKTRSGQDVATGDLTPGYLLGTRLGSIFYLLSDTAVASLIYAARDAAFAARDAAVEAQDAAEEAQADAEAARDIAAGYASDAVSQGNVPIYGTVAGMPALSIPAGISVVRVNGYSNASVGAAKWCRISFADLDGYPARSFFRTTDRFMPNGTTDATNGGYWLLDEDVGNAQHLGAIPDCTGVGVGTDVMPALEAATQYALKRFGEGAKIVLPAGRYRATTPKVLNFGGNRNIALELTGSITPDNAPMTVLKLQNATGFAIEAHVLEGGVFNGWSDPNPLVANYFTTEDVVAAGGQQFIQIEGIFDYTLNLHAKAYAGRVLRTTISSDPTFPQTGAAKGGIYTSRAYGDFSGARIAQALWADAGTTPGAGNWGALERMALDFDYYPPIWVELNDIEIGTIDSAFHTGGPEFRGCVAVRGNYWYVGDVDIGGVVNHVSFVASAAGRLTQNVNVDLMRFLNQGNGLNIDSALGVRTTIEHLAPGSGAPAISPLVINNSVGCDITVIAEGYGANVATIAGTVTDDIIVRPHANAYTSTDDLVSIDVTVGGTVIVNGAYLSYAAAGKSRIKVGGGAHVTVNSPIVRGTTGYVFDLAAGSNVYVKGGDYLGASTLAKGTMPREIRGMTGVADYSFGNRRVNAEANVTGAGGSLEIGIAGAGFESYLPMARLKGKLTNSTAAELQGGFTLQFRPTGASGQPLLDGLEVAETTTDGETVGILLVRILGAYVAKRVKVGASGTGPGGSGSALYIS